MFDRSQGPPYLYQKKTVMSTFPSRDVWTDASLGGGETVLKACVYSGPTLFERRLVYADVKIG